MINELKIFNSSNLITVFIVCLYLLSNFIYEYFILLSILFFIFLFNSKNKNWLNKTNTNLLKFFPIFFYLLRIIKIFTNQNKSIFWDMQLFLFNLNCRVDWSLYYTYKFTTEEMQCLSLGFGPFSEYIYGPFARQFNIMIDPWTTSIFIFVITFLTMIYLIFTQKNTDFLFLNILITFPPFLFLFETLNHDIIFIYYFLVLFKNKKFLDNNFYMFFLTLLTLFKIYPIVILFGVIVYKLISKDYENIKKITTVSLINTTVLLWYYNSLNISVPSPISKVNTFGLFHDLTLIASINTIYLYLFSTFLSIFLISLLILRQKFYPSIFNIQIKEWKTQESLLIIIFSFLSIFINSFSNYGYKFSLNILLFLAVFKFLNKNITLIFLITFAAIPLQYYVGISLENNIIELFLFFLSKTLYYGFLSFTFLILVLHIEKLIKSKN